MEKKYWVGSVPEHDDFGVRIDKVFYDAPTKQGPWATMAPLSWTKNARTPMLGTGYGQRYVKQADGKWLKMEG
jgi:hypothetical protein